MGVGAEGRPTEYADTTPLLVSSQRPWSWSYAPGSTVSLRSLRNMKTTRPTTAASAMRTTMRMMLSAESAPDDCTALSHDLPVKPT